MYKLRPDYQQTLIDIYNYLFSLSPISEDLFLKPLSHLKEHHLKLFWINLPTTRTLEELESESNKNFINVDLKISEIRQVVIQKLLDFSQRIENSVDLTDYATSIRKKVTTRYDKLKCTYEIIDEGDRVVSKLEVRGGNLDCTNKVIKDKTPEDANKLVITV